MSGIPGNFMLYYRHRRHHPHRAPRTSCCRTLDSSSAQLHRYSSKIAQPETGTFVFVRASSYSLY